MATFIKGHRRENLWAEQFWTAAIMGQCDQCVGGVEVTLERAVISFKSPERQQHVAVYAICGLDVIKHAIKAFGV